MKKSIPILFLAIGALAFNSGPHELNTPQAWYETGSETPLDKNITSSIRSSLHFEFHTNQQPKIPTNDNFYSVQKNPKAYFTSYLINTTDSTITISRQDRSVIMIQEAKDLSGTWRPIEHWQYSGCGNSYFDPLQIPPMHYVMIPIKKYSGDLKTKIRLKLRLGTQIFYSSSFQGSVNKSQFKSDSTNSQMFGESYLENPGW